MIVVFRVDSSSLMGLGHLMRCLTLADELHKKNYKVFFICRELTGNLISLIKYTVLKLPRDDNFKSNDLYLNWLGASQEQDAVQTIRIIPQSVDLLIVDSYALDERWHKQLRPYVEKIIVVDDLANKQFDCDMLLNQNLGHQKEDYLDKVSGDCELLLGCDYALLRPEFSELRTQALKKRKRTKEIENILISMGGSDKNNITYDVLQQIDDDDFNITVVLGGASMHQEMIKEYAKGKNIMVIIDAKNMSELMLNADLAIGAGGSTSWERCCLGLPTLQFIIAENQREAAKKIEQLRAAITVRNLQDDLIELASNLNLWRLLSEGSRKICDGLGVKRVVKALNKIQKRKLVHDKI